MRLTALTTVGLAALIGFSAAGPVRAEVTLDAARGSVPLVNSTYSIPDGLGRTIGNNLFHSFSQFNVPDGDTAAFTGPATIRNVVTRVLGGPSSILGTIDSTAMPKANFFLINPAGVMFGPHAQINVGASFTVTTADYIILGEPGAPDRGRFDDRNPANDLLTVAAPTAFGFLGPTPAGISFDHSTINVGAGQSFSVIGGPIQLVGTHVGAASGRVNLIAAGGAGEVALQADDVFSPVDAHRLTALSPISITDHSDITVSGDSAAETRAGRFYVLAQDFTLSGASFMEASNSGTENAPGIDIVVRNALTISDVANISAFNNGSGAGTRINVSAATIHMANNAGLESDTIGSGPAGDITVQTGSLVMEGGAQVGASTSGPGSGGNISVYATSSVNLKGTGYLTAGTFDGPSGNIFVTTPLLQLGGGSQISTDAHGGSPGGRIVLDVGRLEVTSGAFITSFTDGLATGGNVDITAAQILLDGAGDTSFTTGISSRSESSDNAPAGSISLRPAPGGTLSVQVLNNAFITAASLYTGAAGSIDIQATSLTLGNGGSILSSSDGDGPAGNVTVNLSGSLLLSGKSSVSVASSASDGGDVTVNAGADIRVLDSQITGQAAGNGGNVHLTAPGLIYLLRGTLTAHADGGDGGSVTIDPAFVILNDSQINTSAGLNGGNITIVAGTVQASPDLTQSLFFTGQRGINGTVTIDAPSLDLAGNLVPLQTDLLAAESQLGPHCAVRLPGGVSSFVVTGRGGAPVAPDTLLPATLSIGGDGAE